MASVQPQLTQSSTISEVSTDTLSGRSYHATDAARSIGIQVNQLQEITGAELPQPPVSLQDVRDGLTGCDGDMASSLILVFREYRIPKRSQQLLTPDYGLPINRGYMDLCKNISFGSDLLDSNATLELDTTWSILSQEAFLKMCFSIFEEMRDVRWIFPPPPPPPPPKKGNANPDKLATSISVDHSSYHLFYLPLSQTIESILKLFTQLMHYPQFVSNGRVVYPPNLDVLIKKLGCTTEEEGYISYIINYIYEECAEFLFK